MSFNIRFDNPHDGTNAWPYRRELLARIIRDFQTEILGTQEGREPQLRDLASLLPSMSLIDNHREWIEERMYPCLFYSPRSYALIESGDIWLSETPHTPGSTSFESAFPRLCTWARLRHHEGPELLCANVHLDHVKESTRLAQAKVLATELQKLEHTGPVILMGDFNSAPNSLVRNQMIREFRTLKDPWELLGLKEQASYHNFGPIPADATRIDWFLLSEDLKPRFIELDTRSQSELWPSDHYPLKLIIGSSND